MSYWQTLVADAFGRDRHRPQTQEEMRVSVRELAREGLSDHTIASATALSVEAVRRLLQAQGGADEL